VPALREPVQDEAGALSSADKSQIEQLIRAANAEGKIQLQILIVPSLAGEPIEAASLKVVDQWKLGTVKGDQGALFFVAVNDRKMRIEVGQGLEGDIPDVTAKRILSDRVAPFFRAGQMSGGILVGTEEILRAAGVTTLPERDGVPVVRDDSSSSGNSLQLGFFLLIVVFSIISRLFGGRRRRSSLLGGLLLGAGSGGGWDGGRGGGGGWSGGGGGFSGGGASSDW
jgi:uncharacterized protein